MIRSLWLTSALVALGLVASLLPQVTYSSATSGEPSNEVLTAWPGWAVQQDLGQLGGIVGHFDIWVASEPDADIRLTLISSLVDAEDRSVLRQTTDHVTPSDIPVRRTIRFPSYVVPDGQRLVLQLQVAQHEKYAVSYRLARQQSAYRNVMLNGVPGAGGGPLVFAHHVTGSGLRAALHGEPASRIRLALAFVLSGLTVLAHPRMSSGVRRFSDAGMRRCQRVAAWGRRRPRLTDESHAVGPPTRLGRVVLVPWYPWGAAVVPILHFLASNPLHFVAREAVIPTAAALLVVTVAMAGLRLASLGWHQSAAAVTAVTVVFFAYGHVERVLVGRLDESVLFPAGVVLAATAIGIAVRHPGIAVRSSPLLNATTGILLVTQIVTITGSTSAVVTPASFDPSIANESTVHLFDQLPPRTGRNRPDIYYIILDAYGRHDALGEFDNSDFLRELERRGFYIAKDATSNYKSSIQSLASSLNLAYLHDLGARAPKTERDGIALVQDNALTAILKHLGYVYIHLESGQGVTSRAPLADIVATSTPEGVKVVRTERDTRGSRPALADRSEGTADRVFLRTLVHTTALRPLIGNWLGPRDDNPYQWWAPERTLQMFNFLSEPIESSDPKFVFAHIIKPHKPATFDRYGNMFLSKGGSVGFSDAHDPSVPDAYIGQLIFTNSLVLTTVDSILEGHDEEPIIVIAGDHGRSDGYPRHSILAAFHLPDGGTAALYPSISSVNHFRAILDYYFGLNLGLLEDVNVEHESSQFEIEVAATDMVSK